MMKRIKTILCLILSSMTIATAFVSPPTPLFGARQSNNALSMGAESEVDFGTLDGSDIRIGIIRTRWNKNHVDNLVSGVRKALKSCNVTDDSIFETEVPGSYELPYAARLLCLSGTVDAVICAGVLIKGETLHFEYISDAVSKGIMNVGMQTSIPTVFGVLTCLNEEQVVARSTGDNNHGESWGMTAVEMALLRRDAFGKKPMGKMGFGDAIPEDQFKKKKQGVGFF